MHRTKETQYFNGFKWQIRLPLPWNPEDFSLKNEHTAKRGMQENLWVHKLGPLDAPIQSEAFIEVSVSKTQKRLLIGLAHSKDLICAPGGSLAFCLFAMYACLRVRKPLGSSVGCPRKITIFLLTISL